MDQDKFKENSNPYRRLDFEQGLQEEKGFIDLEKSDDDHLKTLEAKIPKIGMEFDSEEAAYEFYNEYAYATGFSIRRTSAHKDNNGKIVDRKFCCSCQGERGQDKRNMNVKSHRPETRSFCPAIMKISARHTSKYKVVAFIAEHIGHGLVSPNKCHRLRSQRKITTEQVAQIDSIEKSGIPPKKGLDYMAQQAGGRENVGFLLEDFRNYLRSKRTIEMKEGDAGGLFHYFQLKQSEDPNFFYAVQVDRDDLIANVFWADTKMKADYAYFGDVVSFDTTYKKNKEGRPFAIFVGVNHHKQSIVFGAALLYDETADTFMWLFDTFQKAMDGKKPETILTDQDAAMAKALEEKWPDTRHRLCIWHSKRPHISIHATISNDGVKYSKRSPTIQPLASVRSHSLTKLLQVICMNTSCLIDENQIFQGQDVGMFPLQDSAQENQHQNASKQDGNGHGV